MSDQLEYVTLAEGMDDEAEACAEVLHVCFGSALKDARAWVARAALPKLRVVKRDGKVAGCLNVFDMGHWFGGASVSSGAISAVGVLSAERGRGVATTLMAEMLRELAGRGIALSTLYPASWPLYRGLGYELAGGRSRIKIPLHHVPRVKPELTVRKGEESDVLAIETCYESFARSRDATLDRAPENWMRIRFPRGERAQHYVFEHGGDVVGYVVMRTSETDAAHAFYGLEVLDVGVSDLCYAAEVLAFLGRSSTLAHDVAMYGGADHPFLALLADRFYDTTLLSDWMIRIVDIEAAFTQRHYPVDLRATLHFDVRDDILKNNAGKRVVEIADGRATVEPGGRGSLRADVRGVAALYTGHLHPAQLVALGILEGDEQDIATAARALAVRNPSMSDMF